MPGILGDTGPVGFEPGMFKQEGELGELGSTSTSMGSNKSKTDTSQQKVWFKFNFIIKLYIWSFLSFNSSAEEKEKGQKET